MYRKKAQTCSKPGSVSTVIYLGCSAHTSCGLPMRQKRDHFMPVYLALLRVGFASH
jgi:hypothetical protein